MKMNERIKIHIAFNFALWLFTVKGMSAEQINRITAEEYNRLVAEYVESNRKD